MLTNRLNQPDRLARESGIRWQLALIACLLAFVFALGGCSAFKEKTDAFKDAYAELTPLEKAQFYEQTMSQTLIDAKERLESAYATFPTLREAIVNDARPVVQKYKEALTAYRSFVREWETENEKPAKTSEDALIDALEQASGDLADLLIRYSLR